MSETATPTRAPGFFWLLTVFLGFVAVAAVLNALFAGERPNPRNDVRAANTAALKEVQDKNLEKLGLLPGNSDVRLTKGLALVQAAKPSTSTIAVPGSPTQLKQAAQPAAPAPAPAAPAQSPAPGSTAPAPPVQSPAAPVPAK